MFPFNCQNYCFTRSLITSKTGNNFTTIPNFLYQYENERLKFYRNYMDITGHLSFSECISCLRHKMESRDVH